MTPPGYLSSFSPNLTDPEDLEAIHVQRQELLVEAVDLLAESALTQSKHHLLFVGARGIGKTHLVALVLHRLSQRPDVTERLRVAWLSEDESSTSLLDFLLRWYRALAAKYPGEFTSAAVEPLFDHPPESALRQLQTLLLEKLGDRTLLVVTENLDTLFDQLSASDLKSWRAYVQDHPVFCTLATAQRLFRGTRSQDDPFFGFFDTRHLKPLSVEEARELLEAIAHHRQDKDLAEFLNTSRGRARVRALHHLVGGNHRLYILLSECIDKESLNSLVAAFNEITDKQLTPYYQERLRWLSPLQRKIVEYLCNSALTVPVKEIARALFAAHSTIAKQLQELRKLGYVRSTPRGRESLYQLAEPLMRVAMQVKRARSHEPLDIIVDFLRIWYDREELEAQLANIGPNAPAQSYLHAAVEKLDPTLPNLRHVLLRAELEEIGAQQCSEDQLETLHLLAEETGKVGDLLRLALATADRGRYDEAAQLYSQVVGMAGATTLEMSTALGSRGFCLVRLGRKQEAIGDYTRIIEAPGAPSVHRVMALLNRGVLLYGLGRSGEAIADYSQVVEQRDVTPAHRALALVNRGVALRQAGRRDEATADYTRVIEQADAPVDQVARALVFRGAYLAQVDRNDEAITDYSRAIDLTDAPTEWIAKALFNRALVFGHVGRSREAIADYTRAINQPDAPGEVISRSLLNRGVTLGQVGRAKEGIADYSQLITDPEAPAAYRALAFVNRGAAFAQLGRSEEGIADFTRVIELPEASAERRAEALIERGDLCAQLGRTEEAIADYSRVNDQGGVLVEQVGEALLKRGATLALLGRFEEANADLSRVIEEHNSAAHHRVTALASRGVTFEQLGRAEEAIADYTRVIESRDAPPALIAIVLFLRGYAYGLLGRSDKEIADYTRVLEHPESSPVATRRSLARLASLAFAAGDLTTAASWLGKANLDDGESTSDFLPAFDRAVRWAWSTGLGKQEFGSVVRGLVNSLKPLGGPVLLSQSLVRHLAELRAKKLVGNEALDAWLGAWEATLGEDPEMGLALRLLRTGIAFLKSKDEAALLDLVEPERRLLSDTFGLAGEKAG